MAVSRVLVPALAAILLTVAQPASAQEWAERMEAQADSAGWELVLERKGLFRTTHLVWYEPSTIRRSGDMVRVRMIAAHTAEGDLSVTDEYKVIDCENHRSTSAELARQDKWLRLDDDHEYFTLCRE